MKKLFFSFVLLLVVFFVNSQPVPKDRVYFSYNYFDISIPGGATPIVGGTNPGDFSTSGGVLNINDGTAYVPLPFNFQYAGTNYSAGTNYLGISTNGFTYLSMVNTNASKITTPSNTNLFTTSTPNNTIAPFWDDLTMVAMDGLSPSVLHLLSGPPGSRVFTVQWGDYPSYSSGNVRGLNFQLKLFETSNNIQFNFGPVTEGTMPGGNSSESASSGLENAMGGNNNYIDGITGSSLVNNSMLSSGNFPHFNLEFRNTMPAPIAPGIYPVGVGQTIPSLSEAIAMVNNRGISGPVEFTLLDPLYSGTAAGGYNLFPLLLGPVSGSSAVNTLTFTGLPGYSTVLNPGRTSGFFGTQDGPTVGNAFIEPILASIGSDYIITRLLELDTGPGGLADRGFLLINSSGTDGATNNIIDQNRISLNRLNPFSVGIEQGPLTPITSNAGSNSFNDFMNMLIENVATGIWANGSSSFPDQGTLIQGNRIGASYMGTPPGDIAGCGIIASNQNNVSVLLNIINNVALTGGTTRGMLLDNNVGNLNTLFFNMIYGVHNSGTTSTLLSQGIEIIPPPLTASTWFIQNNMIGDITSGYTGAPSGIRQIRGINLGSAPNTTFNIDFNSIRIDGSGSPNISSVGIELGGNTSIINLRNNSVSNVTGAQAGVAKHYAIRAAGSNSFGAPGSVSNYNNFFITNTANGFVGLANTTDVPTVPNWTATMTGNPGSDVNSISADPLYIGLTDLHIQSGSPNINTGIMVPGITTDIDNQTRPNGVNPDIGADEFYATLPVGLLYFTGEKKSNGNLLRWTTTSEQNNRGFEIQKLSSNNQYNSIGFISSHAFGGNSNDLLNYEFLDANPVGLKQLYRLRQVDFDERSRFSNIVVIKAFNPSAFLLADVFPNPASDKLSVSFHSAIRQSFIIIIIDAAGRKIKQQLVPADKGSNTVLIDINGVQKGYYLIKLLNATNHEMVTGTFIKQ